MAVFRLLDLPAELRNKIYETCLTHDRTRNLTAIPALLRTCKKVNSEAKGIFKEESCFTLHVNFKLVHDSGNSTVKSCLITLRGDVKADIATQSSSILQLAKAISRNVSKARTVKLHLAVSDDFSSMATSHLGTAWIFACLMAPTTRLCTTIASFLGSEDSATRQIHLHGDMSNVPLIGARFNRLLHALRNIPAEVKIQLSGFPQCMVKGEVGVEGGLEELFDAGRSARCLAFDFLGAYARLKAPVEDLLFKMARGELERDLARDIIRQLWLFVCLKHLDNKEEYYLLDRKQKARAHIQVSFAAVEGMLEAEQARTSHKVYVEKTTAWLLECHEIYREYGMHAHGHMIERFGKACELIGLF